MTDTAGYLYAVEFLRGDEVLPPVTVAPDFAPAVEAARFTVLRRGMPPDVALAADVRVEPTWHDTLGQPYVGGIRAVAAPADGSEVEVRIPLRYFGAEASRASATLVERGLLVAGESLAFLVTAYRRDERTSSDASQMEAGFHGDGGPHPAGVAAQALDVHEVHVSRPLRQQSLAARLGTATHVGDPDPDAVAVLFPDRVIAQARAMPSGAEDLEVGGFLIGYVCRDTGSGDVFLEITDLLPARHTRATIATLTFTPDTWWHARAALTLRQRGESFLGWVHTHPVTAMCRQRGCSEEARRRCPMASGYFSGHDRFLHQTMFPSAYSVALVVNDWEFAPIGVSLFGYRQGLIEPRGFHVVAEVSSAAGGR
jgi:hypothetical protein